MTTTPSPPSPSNLRPAVAPPPPAVGLSVRDAPPKPRPGSLQPDPEQPGRQSTSSRPTPTNCQVRTTRPTRSPSHRSGLSQSSAPSPPDPGPEQPDLRPTRPASLAPARSPSSQAYPRPGLPCHPHACSQILTFRPLPIKPHVIFIGKGRFCLYLCHACICAMPVFALPVDTNIPGTHWGGTGDIS